MKPHPVTVAFSILSSIRFLKYIIAGIVVRAAAANVARGAAISRVGIAGEVTATGARQLAQAGAGGILERSLAQLTANGTRSATLSVSRTGIISSGSYEVAQISPGSGALTIGKTFGGRRTIGGISSESMIVENGKNVVRLRGFLPTSRLRVTLPGKSRFADTVLDRPLMVRVRGIDGRGRYVVSISNGQSFTVDAGFLSLVLLPAAVTGAACSNTESGMVALLDGRALLYDRCLTNGEIVELANGEQRTLVHWNDIDGFIDRNVVAGMQENRIISRNGGVYGLVNRKGPVMEVWGDEGLYMLVNS